MADTNDQESPEPAGHGHPLPDYRAILDVCDREIAHRSEQARHPGWTKWAAFGALGAIGLVLVEHPEAIQAARLPTACATFALLHFIETLVVLLRLASGSSPSINAGRFFKPANTVARRYRGTALLAAIDFLSWPIITYLYLPDYAKPLGTAVWITYAAAGISCLIILGLSFQKGPSIFGNQASTQAMSRAERIGYRAGKFAAGLALALGTCILFAGLAATGTRLFFDISSLSPAELSGSFLVGASIFASSRLIAILVHGTDQNPAIEPLHQIRQQLALREIDDKIALSAIRPEIVGMSEDEFLAKTSSALIDALDEAQFVAERIMNRQAFTDQANSKGDFTNHLARDLEIAHNKDVELLRGIIGYIERDHEKVSRRISRLQQFGFAPESVNRRLSMISDGIRRIRDTLSSTTDPITRHHAMSTNTGPEPRSIE